MDSACWYAWGVIVGFFIGLLMCKSWREPPQPGEEES